MIYYDSLLSGPPGAVAVDRCQRPDERERVGVDALQEAAGVPELEPEPSGSDGQGPWEVSGHADSALLCLDGSGL